MQYFVSVRFDGHLVPLCLDSTSTSLSLCLSPPPQDWEQRPQLPQALTTQSTKEKVKFSFDQNLTWAEYIHIALFMLHNIWRTRCSAMHGFLKNFLLSCPCAVFAGFCAGGPGWPGPFTNNWGNSLTFTIVSFHLGKAVCCMLGSHWDEGTPPPYFLGLSSHLYFLLLFHLRKLQSIHSMSSTPQRHSQLGEHWSF